MVPVLAVSQDIRNRTTIEEGFLPPSINCPSVPCPRDPCARIYFKGLFHETASTLVRLLGGSGSSVSLAGFPLSLLSFVPRMLLVDVGSNP
jgi:hypothetical protein